LPSSNTLPLVLGGVGIASLSLGAASGYFALSDKGIAEDHCSLTVRRCDDTGYEANYQGIRAARLSVVTLISGAVAMGGAILLWQSDVGPSALGFASTGLDGATLEHVTQPIALAKHRRSLPESAN